MIINSNYLCSKTLIYEHTNVKTDGLFRLIAYIMMIPSIKRKRFNKRWLLNIFAVVKMRIRRMLKFSDCIL